MTDLFYSSNQQKYKKYLEENRLREINQEQQQQVIDNELAQKFGLEEQATNIGSLTNRVINKLLTKDAPPLEQTFTPILTDSINNGYLSDLFSFMKTIKAKTEAEQNVINNLKNKEILDKINKENEKLYFKDLYKDMDKTHKETINKENEINTENEKQYFKNLYKDMDKTHKETINKEPSQKLLDDILKNVITKLTNNKNEVEALNNIVVEANIKRSNSISSNDTTEQGSLSEFIPRNERSDKGIPRGRTGPTLKKLETIREQLKRSGISDRSLSKKTNTPKYTIN